MDKQGKARNATFCMMKFKTCTVNNCENCEYQTKDINVHQSENNPQEVPQVKSVDTPKCKCGGRTALSSGRWYYEPDEEPYESGKNEVSKVPEGDAWVHGFICDDCGSVQNLFVDENSYQSRITQLEADYEKSLELIKSLGLSVSDLSKENNKLKEFSNTVKCLQLEKQNSELREVLEELCQLKHYKDQVGKDGVYLERQPKAWESANKLLNGISKDILHIPIWQAKTIENALRLSANQLGCRSEKTALDREVMLAVKHIKKLLNLDDK